MEESESKESLLDEYGEELRFQDQMTERGYILGTAGALAKRTKDQEIWDLNEEKAYLYRRHLLLRYKGPSREKDKLLQREIDLLWRKVIIYEVYGDVERKLRHRAVELLRQHEEQLFGRVKEIVAKKDEDEDQPRASRWSRPRVLMIRFGYPDANEAANNQQLFFISTKN